MKDRFQAHPEISFRRRLAFTIAAAAVAFSVSGSVSNGNAEGVEPYGYKPVPQDMLKPLVLSGQPPEPEGTPKAQATPIVIFDNSPPNGKILHDWNIDINTEQKRPVSEPTDTPEPSVSPTPRIDSAKPKHEQQPDKPTQAPEPNPTNQPSSSGWIYDANISWYGPNFYGKRTACGLKLTRQLVGVASRTLPCGTMVTFMWKGHKVHAPVVDWGPAAWTGRDFDLTGGAAVALGHTWTGPIYWQLGAH